MDTKNQSQKYCFNISSEQNDFETLAVALSKLKLNDSALFYQNQNFSILVEDFYVVFRNTTYRDNNGEAKRVCLILLLELLKYVTRQ